MISAFFPCPILCQKPIPAVLRPESSSPLLRPHSCPILVIKQPAGSVGAVCKEQGRLFATQKHVLVAELGAQAISTVITSIILERIRIISSPDAYYFILLLERNYKKQLKRHLLQRSPVQAALNALMVSHNGKGESKGSLNALGRYSGISA